MIKHEGDGESGTICRARCQSQNKSERCYMAQDKSESQEETEYSVLRRSAVGSR
jgi:hypothetical protein